MVRSAVVLPARLRWSLSVKVSSRGWARHGRLMVLWSCARSGGRVRGRNELACYLGDGGLGHWLSARLRKRIAAAALVGNPLVVRLDLGKERGVGLVSWMTISAADWDLKEKRMYEIERAMLVSG